MFIDTMRGLHCHSSSDNMLIQKKEDDMATMGILETLARGDLDTVLERIERDYSPGALEALAAADPSWRADLERAEREVGSLYAELREADLTVARWRRAVTDLTRLWARVREAEADCQPMSLGEVA
jgi:hypothetical protein